MVSQIFHTGVLNWFVGTEKKRLLKCEVKHFIGYKSLQLIYLGEQIFLFIALYMFVLLWDSSLQSVHFSLINTHGMVKNGIYFCNFWWWMLYHSAILLRKAFRKNLVLLSLWNWKIKFLFSIQWGVIFPHWGSVTLFITWTTTIYLCSQFREAINVKIHVFRTKALIWTHSLQCFINLLKLNLYICNVCAHVHILGIQF